MTDSDIIAWCYAECARQHATTDADINNMLIAYGFAEGIAETPGIEMWEIHWLGLLVDPIANPGGQFRIGPAVFMNGGTAAPAEQIGLRIDCLLDIINYPIEMSIVPSEFYRELMHIHPFKDGNGRVGALLYNVLNGTIKNPVAPPEYK